MTVALFGAGGFVGRALSRWLAEAGHVVLPISSSDGRSYSPDGLLRRDLPPRRDVGAVVYLSQSPYYRDVPAHADHLWCVNVVSAVRAAEWGRRSGASRFVYTSSGNVYQPKFTPLAEDDPLRRDGWYALSKVHAEEALARFAPDMSVTAARLFGVYGPGQRDKLVPNLTQSIREGRSISLQPRPDDPDDLDGLRVSLSYVDDVVAVLGRLALEGGPPVLNVAAPDAVSIRQIADAIGARIGISPSYSMGGAAREGDLVADTRRLQAMWAPAFTPFAAGLDATLAAWSVPR